MSDSKIIKVWEAIKGYLSNLNVSMDSLIKIEFNL